jgi:drug/metabolite transporter (DMT)-like permease
MGAWGNLGRVRPGSAARLGLLAALWGSSFLWIKLALHGLSPVQLTALRLAIGAAVLIAVVHARGLRLPRERETWQALILAAFFANALPYTLFGVGERSVDSTLAGAINATTPLCTFAFGLVGRAGRSDAEPLGTRRVAGLVVGFAGAVLLLAPWRAGHGGTTGGSLACLIASAAYGLSFVYMGRRLVGRGIPPLVLAAGQLTAATGWALIALPFLGRSAVHPHPEVIGAVAAIGLGGTGLAFVLNYKLVVDEGPAVASTVTYLMPIVSVLLGAAFLDESVEPNLILGTAVVLAGVALAQRRPSASGHRDGDGVVGHRDQTLGGAARAVGHHDLGRVP